MLGCRRYPTGRNEPPTAAVFESVAHETKSTPERSRPLFRIRVGFLADLRLKSINVIRRVPA